MKDLITITVAAFSARLFLLYSGIVDFGSRKEISTPFNSFARIKEGALLMSCGIDPYLGDIVHESPIFLSILKLILDLAEQYIPLIFTIADILTGFILYKTSKNAIREMADESVALKDTYAKGTEDLQVQPEDVQFLPKYVYSGYVLNPYAIMSCAGLSLSVLSNLLLSLFLLLLSKRKLFLSLILLALETSRSFYSFVLIAPVLLRSKSKRQAGVYGIGFLVIFVILCKIGNILTSNWTFLDGTLGTIILYRDLQPNVGLFWYFFTEMFEHFRLMFIVTFQMNATILYLVPLSIKFRQEPFLLATFLIGLTACFRGYPSIGDIAFFLALLPVWYRCGKFMAHKFIVFCFFFTTTALLPTLWYLWIYAGSANANFYFGTTLAFCTGQIFLLTDLLFGYIKRDFCLKHGENIIINGVEAKIVLE